MMLDYISVISPLLLHMVLAEAVLCIAGGKADSATCTTLTAIIVIPAALWMYQRDRKKWSMQKNDSLQKGILFQTGFGCVCFALGAVLNILWSGVLNRLHITEYFSNQTQEALLTSQILVQVIGLGVLVPIAEELIFRGLIYQRMKHLMPVGAAVALASLIFALYHGNAIQILFALPMSLVLILVYEKGRGFIFPVLFHMGANLTAVLLNLI